MITQIQTAKKPSVMIQGEDFYLEMEVLPEIWEALDAIQDKIGIVPK